MTQETAASRAVTSLQRLEEYGYHVTEEQRTRLAELTAATFTDETVYASIGIDDDGELGLHWIAANRSMEVSLIPGEEWFIFVTDGKENYTQEGNGPLPVEDLRRHFAEFSAFVKEANPNWRKTLADAY